MTHIHRLAVLSYGAIPRYSLCYSPLPISLAYSPFPESPLLTWNPSSCVVRSRPPWSQVAHKLTSPFPSLPIPNFHPPRGFPKSIVRPTKTRSRLHIVRNINCVKCKPLTAGKNVMALSVNGMKMTSVRCPLNINKIKCHLNVKTLTVC